MKLKSIIISGLLTLSMLALPINVVASSGSCEETPKACSTKDKRYDKKKKHKLRKKKIRRPKARRYQSRHGIHYDWQWR